MTAWSSRNIRSIFTPTRPKLSPKGTSSSMLTVVKRGNPCASMAINGMRGWPLNAFITHTRPPVARSSSARPASSENEISGNFQPRHETRPSNQSGAFGTRSGVDKVITSDTFAFGISTRPLVIGIINPRISRLCSATTVSMRPPCQ